MAHSSGEALLGCVEREEGYKSIPPAPASFLPPGSDAGGGGGGGASSGDASTPPCATSSTPFLPGSTRAVDDWEQFRTHGKAMVDAIADYYQGLAAGAYPTKAHVEPGYLQHRLPTRAPEAAESMEDIMRDVHAHIMPGITHWQSPSFFAYFPAHSSPPAMLGDMLSDAINCIGFSWVASPASTELETVVMDWLRQLLDLPQAFASSGTGGGVIQGTASEATLVALLAARERALTLARAAADGDGAVSEALLARLVCYASEQAHSSVKKASMVAGLLPHQFRLIPAPGPTFAMSADALRAAIAEDQAAGRIPFFVCASLGTTSTGAFDPLPAIVDVAAAASAWVHVDAAWAGAAAVCPEHRAWLAGVEGVDSFDFNPHKWLRVNMDCSAMFVRDRRWLINALSITPEYLRSREYDAGLVSDYRDWQVPLGRRFRALKLWFVLRMYGAEALRAGVRAHCALAQQFAAWVRADERFELCAPPSLALVCFRLRAEESVNAELLDRINDTAYLVHTKADGVYMLRMALGGLLTEERHVRDTWTRLQTIATELLNKYSLSSRS